MGNDQVHCYTPVIICTHPKIQNANLEPKEGWEELKMKWCHIFYPKGALGAMVDAQINNWKWALHWWTHTQCTKRDLVELEVTFDMPWIWFDRFHLCIWKNIFVQILGTNKICIHNVGVLSWNVWPRGLTNIGKRINNSFSILCLYYRRNTQNI